MKSIKASLLATLALSSFGMTLLPVQSASAATTRTASVEVKNQTDQSVSGIRMTHKYSTKFTDEGQLYRLSPQQSRVIGQAKYRTGFGTTGRDWWKVSWNNHRGQTCVTSPGNLQGGAFKNFKKNTLTSKDDGKTVKILIKPNNIVTFTSPSGGSDTIYDCN